jgi:hypothetical protein
MFKTYRAAYKMRLLLNQGSVHREASLMPSFTTKDEMTQALIEGSDYFEEGVIWIDAESDEAPDEKPKKRKKPIAPAAAADPTPEEYRTMHHSKLFVYAKKKGYPVKGSKKKEDLLAFLVGG